jgi:hypothetical protein
VTPLQASLSERGFAFVAAATMRALLARFGQIDDWAGFAASWNDLGRDTYMADGGRYRKRRFAVFSALPGIAEIHRAPHQPHYQSRDYNALNGGIERWFPPVLPEIAATASLQTIRDGVDYVLVLMIERHNIRSGETSIHALDGRPLGSFTLTAPLDAALVDDRRVYHGVTAVEPIDPGREAHRDVLVVTFRQQDPPG